MAKLICDMHDCVHISKRPLRSCYFCGIGWTNKVSGTKRYGGVRKNAAISRIFNPDGDIEAVTERVNKETCSFYEPREKEKGGAAFKHEKEV